MTPRQADRIIKKGNLVIVHWPRDPREAPIARVFVSRDRWTITTSQGEKFHRDELEIVTENKP